MTSSVLSLQALEDFDPHAPPGSSERRFLCPLPECGQLKPRDAAHRCLALEVASGLWHCFRCGQGGKLQEHWDTAPRLSPKSRARQALRRRFEIPTGNVYTLPQYALGAPPEEGIPDPYGHTMTTFRASVRQLLDCVDGLVGRLEREGPTR